MLHQQGQEDIFQEIAIAVTVKRQIAAPKLLEKPTCVRRFVRLGEEGPVVRKDLFEEGECLGAVWMVRTDRRSEQSRQVVAD
jgi:hypothetical protein